MAAITKKIFQLNGKTAILCLVGWFLTCAVFYAAISIWENNRRQAIIKNGVSISKDISSQSGLPLLERNTPLLSQLIEKIKERPEVVFASIIDHKNKIIAYTDQEQFFTLNKQKTRAVENVHYWRISEPNSRKVMNFSSEVTFSNTRVGEVFISLKAENMDYLKQIFLFSAVLGFLAIGILFGISRYNDCISLWGNVKESLKSRESSRSIVPAAQIFCPLCGHAAHYPAKGFPMTHLDNFYILKHSPFGKGAVLLSDIAENDDLSWLKKLLVTQCTRIINKVAAE